MLVNWFNDTVILFIIGAGMFTKYYLDRRWKRRTLLRVTAEFASMGLYEAVANGQTILHTYNELRHITAHATLSNWRYWYDKDMRCHILCDEHRRVVCTLLADDDDKPEVAAQFRHIATFNPRLMLAILNRLQSCEFILHTIQNTSKEPFIHDLISLAEAQPHIEWDFPPQAIPTLNPKKDSIDGRRYPRANTERSQNTSHQSV